MKKAIENLGFHQSRCKEQALAGTDSLTLGLSFSASLFWTGSKNCFYPP
jgi:hypothetical protein